MDFSALNQRQSDSFVAQKTLLKKLMLGKTCLCDSCKQALSVKFDEQAGIAYVKCKRGCTELQLEFGR
ncbi:hypothetical protein PALB_37050 [Pseudoalteromonas luteoviolacea B = ATCC 29581]|nr:hypothetical protein PALB_37050 [Pseudoalteromonas luteoviolacea B = ATCC 29581]